MIPAYPQYQQQMPNQPQWATAGGMPAIVNPGTGGLQDPNTFYGFQNQQNIRRQNSQREYDLFQQRMQQQNQRHQQVASGNRLNPNYQPGGGTSSGGGIFGAPSTGYQTDYGGGIINTSIQPQQPFTPDLTQRAQNQAVAGQHELGNMDFLRNMLRRPGQAMSSPGLTSQALPQYAQAMGGAGEAFGRVGLGDAVTNANFLTQGQGAREDEGLGWARIQSALRNAGQSAGLDMMLELMRTFMG